VFGGSIANSSGLSLFGGAIFKPNAAYSLDGKSLSVDGSNGQGTTFDGDLDANNYAHIALIAAANANVPLLTVNGDADIRGSEIDLAVSGGTDISPYKPRGAV
jgi:hypothetical protein